MNVDLSNLAFPGASASGPMPTPDSPVATPPADIAPPNVGGPSAPETGINPQVPPTPPTGGTPVGTPNPVPHARLLAMIHGLSIGLSNAGKSMATGGREGGASGVIADEAAEQQQKI